MQNMSDPTGRLCAWVESLQGFDLPDWDALPQLDLYMDQVMLLLTRYLAPLAGAGEEKFLTASIINNYVRLKVLPPPVKKKYSRLHLAELIILCTLKQSLSIASIRRLLPAAPTEEAVRTLYTAFVGQMRTALARLHQAPQGQPPAAPLPAGGDLAVASAITATLAKSLTEFLLAAP